MIEIKDMCAGYGQRQILKDISVSFKKGKLTAVIGPNGSGKTTLIKSIIGFIPITSGNVFVDGQELSSMSVRDTAKKIAYLPQGQGVSKMTVAELVLHGRFAHLGYPRIYGQKDKMAAAAAIKRMGISEYAEKKLSELSGGMRQNAYIAMALAQNSEYIFMDEPTTYLDIANRISLMKTMRELADEGHGVVAVLHDISIAMEFADEIAVIKDGRLYAFGTPDEIYRTGTVDAVFGVRLAQMVDGKRHIYCFDCESVK